MNEEPRGFMPVISIPIVVSAPNNNDRQIPTLKDANITLDVRLNTYYQEYLRLLKENKLIKTTIEHVKKEKTDL